MRLGVITSGGDAPGMNPAIASLVREACKYGYDIIGFRYGYKGILRDDFIKLGSGDVTGLYKQGGSVLFCGRLPEMKELATQKTIVEKLRSLNVNALAIIGGDGSFQGGLALSRLDGNIKIAGLPATIDNNIFGSDYTLGYDTALNKLTAYIDDITDTGISMPGRIFLVETLGAQEGYFPYAAFEMGIADMCVISETQKDDDETVGQIINLLNRKESGSVIVTISEGMHEKTLLYYDRLVKSGYNAKINMIGYQQRGGTPTARERLHAANFAAAAVNALRIGEQSQYVVYVNGGYKLLPFEYASRKKEFRFHA